MSVFNLNSPDALGQSMTEEGFMCQITARFVMSSLDRLVADGIKTVSANTQSGHAVLLMHDLMTLREMRHAIT